MAEREITTVFRADISQFSASTQELNRYVSQVNSEFKNATASMNRWNDNTDGLQAKLTQLNGVLDAEKKKLASLEDEYNKLTDEQKRNTAEGQKLATAINNQNAKVKEIEKNISHYSNNLRELEDAGVNSREELEKLNKEIEDQKQAAKELGGGILKGAAVGIAGIGAACVGALSSLSSIVEETKELRTQMGMLETSFTEAGLGVEASKKTFDDLYSVIGDNGAATEAALHLGEFAATEKELEELTNSLTGAYARFGDSLPLQNIAEGVNTTLALNQANAGMVDAIEFAGGNVEEFNEKLQALTSEEEKRQFIIQTLNDSYAEAGNTYKEVNAEVMAANDAQNQYNQAMADVGEKVQPVMTNFKLAMVGVLQTVLEKFNEVDIAGLVGKISTAIANVVDVALPPLMTALSWVIDNISWLGPLLGGLVGTIAAISAGIKIYNTVVAIAKAVQLAWNLALSANPIGLIVMAIVGLVAAFVTLWNKCEAFRDFWKGFINLMIDGVNALIKGLNKLEIDIPDWVPGIGGGKLGFDIPLIPKLAKGGIVDQPTLAMVGEAGKEAVLPLENNTGWINQLADKLSTRLGNSNVTYNINNKFEKMETSRLALHRSNLELKKIIKGGY